MSSIIASGAEDDNDNIPDPIKDQMGELSNLDSDALIRAWGEAWKITQQMVVRMAAIYLLLERRGYDMSQLPRCSEIRHIRRLAYGQIIPEVITEPEHNSVRNALSKLPLRKQRELIQTGVPVAIVNAQHQIEVLRVPVNRLDPEQARQVFEHESVRSPEEQRAWMQVEKVRVEVSKAKPVEFVADHPRRGFVVRIGGETSFVPVSEIQRLGREFK